MSITYVVYVLVLFFLVPLDSGGAGHDKDDDDDSND
jgi:hypothetical protein